MDSKELFKQFWAVGDESVWGDETKRMWKVWQAAWNARQPEVVSGDVDQYYLWRRALGFDDDAKMAEDYSTEEIEIVNEIRKLLAPASSVLVPTIDELAEAMYQDNTALLTNVEARYIAKVVHALLTKGRGGA